MAQAITEGLLGDDIMADIQRHYENIDVYTTTPGSIMDPLPPFAEESTNCVKKIIIEKGLAPIAIANRTALNTFVHINAVRLASQVVLAYKRFLNDVAQQLGATTSYASSFSDDMFHFEKWIAEVTPSMPLTPNDTPLLWDKSNVGTLDPTP